MVWENTRVGGPPHPHFGARESKETWNFCRKSSIGRYTGVQHCSAGPAQSRQKYPKIGQISAFSIFLDKIRVGGPPPYFGAVATNKIGHFSRKTPFCRLFELREKTAAKIIGVNPKPYKTLKNPGKILGETGHRGIRVVRLQDGTVIIISVIITSLDVEGVFPNTPHRLLHAIWEHMGLPF